MPEPKSVPIEVNGKVVWITFAQAVRMLDGRELKF